jgi:hypothetical protein
MIVNAVPGPRGLADDLHEFCSQFEALKIDAENLLTGLNDLQFNWRPSSNSWSIAECIDHLVVTGRLSIANIYYSISEARSRGLLSPGPFRYSAIEKFFVRAMEPTSKIKFRAPKAYVPSPDHTCAELTTSFIKLQDEFLLCLKESNGIDLSRVKVSNPVSKWIRFSLGQEFALNTAHERRHLWQARRIISHPAFPQSRE